jgi:hypothetical protein
MTTGSCLCGQVRYELAGPGQFINHCHCSMCRKAHGAAFRTRASVGRADFRFVAGEELVQRYRSSPGTERSFCRVCGANLVSFFDDRPDVLGFPLGTLDDDPGVKPVAHMHVASKAPWHDITDDLPCFETVPPGP